MSREAFGDPPESQEPPDLCPVCGNDWHAEDCEFGKEVARRLKAERDAHRLAFENEQLRRDAMRYRFVRTADRVPISSEAARDPVAYDAAIDREMAKNLPPSCKTRSGCSENGCLGWCDEYRPDPALKPDIAALQKRMAEDPGFAAQVTGDRPPTPVGWSDTDWLKHLEEIRQDQEVYHRGPLPETGWD